MHGMRGVLRLSVFSLVAACGTTVPATTPPSSKPLERAHVHPALPATLNAFHDVLSPVWHTPPGANRIAAACAQAALLRARADALVTEPAPPEAASKLELWKARTTVLASRVGTLGSACEVEGRPEVEATLVAVHEAYHELGTVVADMGDHADHHAPPGSRRRNPGEH